MDSALLSPVTAAHSVSKGSVSWVKLLVLFFAFLAIGAKSAHAAQFYYVIELKDGTGKVINHFEITIEASTQEEADTLAARTYEGIRSFACVLINPSYCRAPNRWDVYRAVKVKKFSCSVTLNDVLPAQVGSAAVAPTPSCREEEVFEIRGPSLLSNIGDVAAPTPSPVARYGIAPAQF